MLYIQRTRKNAAIKETNKHTFSSSAYPRGWITLPKSNRVGGGRRGAGLHVCMQPQSSTNTPTPVPSCSSIHVYAIPGVASCEYRSLYESVKRRARSEASFWSPSPSFSRSRSLGQKKAACLSVTQPSVEPVVTFSATAHTHEFRRNPPPHPLLLPPSLLATRANRRGGGLDRFDQGQSGGIHVVSVCGLTKISS